MRLTDLERDFLRDLHKISGTERASDVQRIFDKWKKYIKEEE